MIITQNLDDKSEVISYVSNERLLVLVLDNIFNSGRIGKVTSISGTQSELESLTGFAHTSDKGEPVYVSQYRAIPCTLQEG